MRRNRQVRSCFFLSPTCDHRSCVLHIWLHHPECKLSQQLNSMVTEWLECGSNVQETNSDLLYDIFRVYDWLCAWTLIKLRMRLRRHLNKLAASYRHSGLCKLLPQYEIIILFFSKGSFVVQALAGPGNVTYELGGDAGASFAISNSSGNITILTDLDREVSYKLMSRFLCIPSFNTGICLLFS